MNLLSNKTVYMAIPATVVYWTGDAFDDIFDFCIAWLCSPLCDSNDLIWDYDNDYDITFKDWAYHEPNFADVNISPARVNGRYILTDYMGSVIGIAKQDGTAVEISYDAWGTPYYIGSIDGLTILWNGYYFDDETDNYYLRNRYYSILERRFVTEDPHGIVPDGIWNNPFVIHRQYIDGLDLSVYGQGNPINFRDKWGLWRYALAPAERTKEARTFVFANSVSEWKYGIKGLAQMIGLNEEEFDKWGERALHKVNGRQHCGAWVPNTAFVNKGDVAAAIFAMRNLKDKKGEDWAWITKRINWTNLWLSMELNDVEDHFREQGYKTVRLDRISSKKVLDTQFANSKSIAWAFAGHGLGGGAIAIKSEYHAGELVPEFYYPKNAKAALDHQLAEVIMLSCYARQSGQGSWQEIVSPYGTLRASTGLLNAMTIDWDELPTE